VYALCQIKIMICYVYVYRDVKVEHRNIAAHNEKMYIMYISRITSKL